MNATATQPRVLMPHWECVWWQNVGMYSRVEWKPTRTVVMAGTRELARERAARQFACVVEFVTVRYVGNR